MEAGSQAQSTPPPADDLQNAAHFIEGEALQLRDGVFDSPTLEGSIAKDRVDMLGPLVLGDLDGDGDNDAVASLSRVTGGSRSFCYFAAAPREGEGYRGTAAHFVGDRIAPRDVVIEQRVVRARFLDRRPDEPMAAAPAVVQVRDFTAESAGLRPVDNPFDSRALNESPEIRLRSSHTAP